MLELEDTSFQRFLRTMRIFAFALIMGVAVFFGIALFLVDVSNQGRGLAPMGPQPLLSYVAVGFMVVTAPLSFVFPTFVMHNMVRRIAKGDWRSPANGSVPDTDASKLLATRQTMLIVGLALLEGACHFACIAYLLEGNVLARWAVVVGLSLQIVRFPTQARVRNWLDEQSERVARLRLEP